MSTTKTTTTAAAPAPKATPKKAVVKKFIFVAVEPDLYRLTIGPDADHSKVRKLRNYNSKEILKAVTNASNFAGKKSRIVTLKKADLVKPFGSKIADGFQGLKAHMIA